MNNKVNKILDFAIESELEAVKFYTELMEIVNFKNRKAFLQELADMEKGHAELLKNIKGKVNSDSFDFKNLKVEDVETLNLSEYLVPADPTPELSYQDILIIAMKREEKAYQLYNKTAMMFHDEDVKQILLKLASEESKHKHSFEELYDEKVLNQN